jgi:hypothetical protein
MQRVNVRDGCRGPQQRTYPCNGQSALCRCLTLGLASPCIVGVGGSELNTLNSCGAIMGYDYARVYVIDRCANSGNLD